MLKIGPLKLDSRFMLAPLAGITDLPYRLLNRRFGCPFAFVEMINVRCLSHKSRKTKGMLQSEGKDRPLGVQILGCEPAFIERGLDVLSRYDFDLLDFNAACPEKKVTRRGEGSSLLKDPVKLQRLLKLVVKNTKLPVTVKIRAGWDKDSVNAREVALRCQEAGVKAVFIHGRTKMQLYAGKVDYTVIRDVKKALSIPVIGSGDIFSPELAKKMFDETGCDGVTVARGSLGNPWIFRELDAHFKGEPVPPRPDAHEIGRVMVEHLDATADFYGEKTAVILFRKFFGWYTRGFRGVRPVREKVSHIKKRDEMVALVEEFCTLQPQRGVEGTGH
ncbi:MAG: tRNA dihydrouridine synthase DusB [Deltaproteobacteria bacterium]